jgi:hypothetical protein
MFGRVFGDKEKLAQQLAQEGGIVAWATITNLSGEWNTARVSNFSEVTSRTKHVKITVMVQPEDGNPFEASFRQAFTQTQPSRGWQCKVIYDPKDPSRIAVLEDSITPPGMDRATADSVARMRGEAMAAVARGNITQYVESLKARAVAGQPPGTKVADASVPQAPAQVSQASKPNVVDQLSKLADLRDRGVLSQAEFEAQKAKLLAES